MNTAEHVITKVGGGSMARGVKLVSVWLRRSRTRIYSMTYPRERGGTDGLIPSRDQLPILLNARSMGIDLTAEDMLGLADLPPLGTPANCNDITVCAGASPRDDNAGEKVT